MPSIQRVSHFDVNVGRVLGEGGFGKVYRAKDIAQDPPTEVAAKQMALSNDSRPAMEREVQFMKTVGDHPSIIGFKECVSFGDEAAWEGARNTTWIFMEMATGGELFDRLIDSGNLSERAVRPFFRGMAEALLHCHSRGIVHRDIKLENVMLCAEDPHAVKLVDFGLAVQVPPQSADGAGAGPPAPLTPQTPQTPQQGASNGAAELFYDRVGSKSYRAPEILAGAGYLGPPVDVWALGITVFALSSGFFPLDEARNSDWRYARLAQDQLRRGLGGIGPCDSIYAMYRRACPFTPELKELLDGMLTIDAARRTTMAQIAAHRFFEAREAERSSHCDDEGDEVMYRSAGGGEGEEGEEAAAPFELPEMAMPISRQRAKFDVSSATPA